MAREASALTVKIRELCDSTNNDITHSEARPLLKKAGFDIAPEPNRELTPMMDEFSPLMDAAYKRVKENYDFDAKNPDHVTKMQGIAAKDVAAKLGWNPVKAKSALAEYDIRKAFLNERNSFDVVKYNWKIIKESGGESRKPAPAETPKGAVAKASGKRVVAKDVVVKAPRPKHRGAATVAPVGNDMIALLAFIKENGGFAATQKKAESLRQEAEDFRQQAEEKDDEAAKIEAALEQAVQIRKMLDAA